MFKLEKIGKSRELNVLLRSKPTLLTAPFLFALGYATFIHLAAFFLFEISPFKPSFEAVLFPPVNVAIEAPSGAHATHLDLVEESIPSFLLAPMPEIPSLPDDFKRSVLNDYQYLSPDASLADNSFLALESSAYLNEWDLKTPHFDNQISISLSGGIADLTMHPLSLQENQFSKVGLSQDQRLIFNVKVDLNRGEICWWEPLSHQETAMSSEFIEILKQIRFAPEIDSALRSGEVEIVLIDRGKRHV